MSRLREGFFEPFGEVPHRFYRTDKIAEAGFSFRLINLT